MNNPFKDMKAVNVIPPGVIKDGAAFVSNVIDTAMAGGARFLVLVIALGATDIAMDVLRVMQSETKTNDTTLGGSPAELVDVTDTITPSATDDNGLVIVSIDLTQPHSRYMLLEATAGDGTAGTYLAALGFFTNVGSPAEDIGALAFVDV